MVDGLAELHTHLGGSVSSDILWSLAHEQGIALPVKDYWEFDRLVTVSDPRGVPDLDALNEIYEWTELIQSSPLAVERSVHAAIGGAYRSQGITTLELRFNPMKRNRGGERDLDHIIMAATRGLDLASLEYPQVRAGLILMMDRTFTGGRTRSSSRRRSAMRRAASSASTSPGRGPAASAIRTRSSRRSSTRRAMPASASPSTSARRAASTASTRSPRWSRHCGPTESGTASSRRASLH